MKILVTGGAGFIGSNFIKFLVKNGHKDIIVVDKLTYAGNLDNLKGYENKVIFYQVGIEEEIIKSILSTHKPEVIVNFAAMTHVDRSINNPKAFLETDVLGLYNLVYWSIKLNIPKVIHISTDEVYGDSYKNEALEDFPLKPNSPYSASKASGDLLLRSYYKTYGLPVVIVRPSNNYGPNQYPEKLIPMAITRLIDGKKILLHGNGREIREWVYVEDCCRAIYNVMLKGSVGEIYNIGSRERINNLMVIKQIIDSFGYGSDYSNFIQIVPNRPGNDKRYAINSNKLKNEIGDYLTVRFKEGIQMTIDWYKKNEWWWRKLNVNLDSNIYKENDEYLR